MKDLIADRLKALERECVQAKPDFLSRKQVDGEEEERRRTRVRELCSANAHDLGHLLADAEQQKQLPELREQLEGSLQVVLDTPITRVRTYTLSSIRHALGVIEGFTRGTEGEGELIQRVLDCLVDAVRRSFGSAEPRDEGRTAEQISAATEVSPEDGLRLLTKLIGWKLIETPPELQVEDEPTLYAISTEGQFRWEETQQI